MVIMYTDAVHFSLFRTSQMQHCLIAIEYEVGVIIPFMKVGLWTEQFGSERRYVVSSCFHTHHVSFVINELK